MKFALNINFVDLLFILHSHQWLLDKQDLTRERQYDLKILGEDELQKVMIFFANCKCRNKSEKIGQYANSEQMCILC